MKKSLVVLIVLLSVLPLFSSVICKWGGSANLGTELFFENKTIAEPSFGAVLELPSVIINGRHSLSLPFSYNYISNWFYNGRYKVMSSNRVGLGLKYSYQFNKLISAGLCYEGGFWLFNASGFIYPATVYHKIGAEASYKLHKHLKLALPVSYTRATFGNTMNVSVSLIIN